MYQKEFVKLCIVTDLSFHLGVWFPIRFLCDFFADHVLIFMYSIWVFLLLSKYDLTSSFVVIYVETVI